MAAYRADIEIGVKGVRQLEQLRSSINLTATSVDSLNEVIGGRGGLVQSIQNYANNVARASKTLKNVGFGDPAEIKAIREQIRAIDDLNAATARQQALIARVRAESRQVTATSNAGYGQQTPALPPAMVRAREISQNWSAFFRDAAEIGSDLRSTAAARGLNIRTNWDVFFSNAAELASDIKTTTAAKSLNLKNNWTQFFTEATEVANDIKTTTAAKSLNLKSSWNAFFKEANDLALELRSQALGASGRARIRQAENLAAYQAGQPRENFGYTGKRPALMPAGFTSQDVRIKNLLDDEKKLERIRTDLRKREEIIYRNFQINRAQSALDLELDIIEDIFNTRVKLDEAFWDNASRNLKEFDAEQRKLNKKQTADAKSRQNEQDRLGGRLSSATIGGFFPLLFGQGPGAALGGAIGGFAGGGKFGFAGSLAGTFAGQATIDFAVNSAVRLGQALRSPTANIEQLTKFLGIAGTALNTNIKVLQSLGLTSTASAVALAKLEETLGKEGYKNAEQLAKDLSNLENAFGRLQLAAANVLSRPLGQFIDFLVDVINQFNKINVGQGGGRMGRLAQTAIENPPGAPKVQQTGPAGGAPSAEQLAAKAISDERARQIQLASAQKRLDQDRLSLTRVELAIRENDIALLQSANELERKRLEYKNAQAAKDKERTALLEIEMRVLEQQRAQQEAAKQNAIIEAQRQVDRDILNIRTRTLETDIAIRNVTADRITLHTGEAAGLDEKIRLLEQEKQQRIEILGNQQMLELMGVNEVNVRKQIINMYNGMYMQMLNEIQLRKDALQQQRAQYELTRLQVQQALELQEVQTRAQAQLEVARARSFADPQGVGIFGEARRSRNLALREYMVNVAGMETQVAAGQQAFTQAFNQGVNPDVLVQMNDALNTQRQQLALYKELQPAIISARYEQEKYNEVLGYTTTFTQSMFQGIDDFIAGTMEKNNLQKQIEQLERLRAGVDANSEAFSRYSDEIAGIKSQLAQIGDTGTRVQQILVQMMKSVVDAFLEMAQKIIAQQLAMIVYGTILKALGVSGGVKAPSDPTAAGGDVWAGVDRAIGPARAAGGPVLAGMPYLVGENGPELFVPGRTGKIVQADQTEALMASRAALNSGGSTSADVFTANREAMSASASLSRERYVERVLTSGAGATEIKYSRVGSGDLPFVTEADMLQATRLAAQEGARLGQQRTIAALRNNPGTRRAIGV